MKEKKHLKKKLILVLRWIGWVLLVQLILINVSAAFYAYKFTHYYASVPSDAENASQNIFGKTWRLFTGPKFQRSVINEQPVFPFETIKLKAKNDTPIEAWYGRADSAARGTVILFHGITVSKTQLLEEAYEFRYWGYNVLLVDLRGHGNSGSNKTTIGYREAEEVELAYEFIAEKGEKKIFLFGISLGAVVITKAIADYQLKPAGIIIEMPFISLQAYLKAKARVLGFPQQPFAFLTTGWIGIEQGFNGYKHKTTRYAGEVTCPVLMQAGARDELVLQSESKKIFEALAAADKKLVIYEKAQHESFLHHDPARWRTEVEAFLMRH